MCPRAHRTPSHHQMLRILSLLFIQYKFYLVLLCGYYIFHVLKSPFFLFSLDCSSWISGWYTVQLCFQGPGPSSVRSASESTWVNEGGHRGLPGARAAGRRRGCGQPEPRNRREMLVDRWAWQGLRRGRHWQMWWCLWAGKNQRKVPRGSLNFSGPPGSSFSSRARLLSRFCLWSCPNPALESLGSV